MVNLMKPNQRYHFFLFLSTFSRGLIEIFSLVLLHKKGLNINQILIFLLLTYLFAIPSIIITIKSNKKIILILSNIIYGISFLYLSKISLSKLSIVLLASLISFSNYTYHLIRHYYALNMNNNPNIIVIITYISLSISSLLGSLLLEHLSPLITSIIVLILSIISILPISKYKNKPKNIKLKLIKLEKKKLLFSILEQNKIILIELQPLFLYLYIKKSYNK